MSPEEVAEFEKNPNLKEIIAVRYLDEAEDLQDGNTRFLAFRADGAGLVNRHLTNLSQRVNDRSRTTQQIFIPMGRYV